MGTQTLHRAVGVFILLKPHVTLFKLPFAFSAFPLRCR